MGTTRRHSRRLMSVSEVKTSVMGFGVYGRKAIVVVDVMCVVGLDNYSGRSLNDRVLLIGKERMASCSCSPM